MTFLLPTKGVLETRIRLLPELDMAAYDDEEMHLLSSYDTSYETTETEECFYERNKTDEISINMDCGENSESTTCMTLAELTEDKKYHLFISSASDDRDLVLPVVEELERTHGVRCLFHDRDFQPGTAVLRNIKEGISSSLKTVVFLTPKFMESNFCTLELEIAMNNPMVSGFSSLIPVLYQDCKVPFHLEPRTYLDATLPQMTVSKLALNIKTALDRSEPANENISVKLTSKYSKYKNGTSVSIVADVKRRCMFRPNQYQFYLTHTTLRSLKDHKIDASPRQLQQVITLLNNDLLSKHHGLLKEDFKSRCSAGCRWSCVVCPLGLFLCAVIYIILVFCIARKRPSEETVQLVLNPDWIAYFPLLMTLFFVPVLCWTRRFSEREASVKLKEKLWYEVTSRTYRNGLAFSFCDTLDWPPMLKVMRYDVLGCKQYIMALLKSRACTNARRKNQDYELQADEAIYFLMKRICSDDFNKLDVPEADQNRHNVVNDRMCLCQLYERDNPPA